MSRSRDTRTTRTESVDKQYKYRYRKMITTTIPQNYPSHAEEVGVHDEAASPAPEVL